MMFPGKKFVVDLPPMTVICPGLTGVKSVGITRTPAHFYQINTEEGNKEEGVI